MNASAINQELLSFLQQSPSPFHATTTMLSTLKAAGFVQLHEKDVWQLQPDTAYVVTRNESSIIAFTTGRGDPAETGIAMAGAHTDSPCLKLKPNAITSHKAATQFAVEIYGGALLAPWFDRDLSLAGRVAFKRKSGELASALLDWQRPIAMVPSLAIHLDREANNNRTINPQTQMPPIFALNQGAASTPTLDSLVADALSQQLGVDDFSELLAHELFFYDTQPPAMVGLNQEFIASARLDNLLSCYLCTDAIRHAAQQEQGQFSLMVCNDHEEVGSVSACGAQGPFLQSVLSRISARFSATDLSQPSEAMERMIRQSLFLSIDNAHGLHPNFADKHDAGHGPLLNQGPVIKINANQRYASNSQSTARFVNICQRVDVPHQSFVVRSDMGCGSTIGPITASGLGVETIDIGVPTWGMHSIRETAGSQDAAYLSAALRDFFTSDAP